MKTYAPCSSLWIFLPFVALLCSLYAMHSTTVLLELPVRLPTLTACLQDHVVDLDQIDMRVCYVRTVRNISALYNPVSENRKEI
jgi:precorrin-3B methylase